MIRTNTMGWMLALLLSASLTVVAPQSAGAVGIEKGLRVGMNFANVEGDLEDEFQELFGTELGTRFGAQAGGWIAVPISPGFALQFEALWTEKGAQGDFTVDTGSGFVPVDVTFTLTYVDIPALLRIDVPGAGVRPRFYVGPTFGIPIDGTIRIEALGEEEEEEIDDLEVELGGLLGAGLAFPTGAATVGIDLRYQMGFTEIGSDADTRNRVLSVSMWVGF